MTFRNVLAFENFILLMAVIFGLQFVDRSFGPVLPLYVAELGTPADRVPIVAGVIFSIAAGAGAVGHHVCGALLRRAPARRVIAWSVAVGAAGAVVYVLAGGIWMLLLATPLFGIAIGVATTAAYTAASSVMPATARGAGFGLLDDRVARGPGAEPDRERNARRHEHPRGVPARRRRADRTCIYRVAADDRGAAAGDDRTGDRGDLKGRSSKLAELDAERDAGPSEKRE